MLKRTKYLYKKAQKAYSKIRYGQACYVPRMIDFNQVLRSDGGRHSWGENYYSQCGQDWFLDFLFSYKNNGFFLDIGGNDPIFINNTYFFEKKGWEGLAFEPLKKYQEKWKEQRPVCQLL